MTPDISAIAQKWADEVPVEFEALAKRVITAAIEEATASLRAQQQKLHAEIGTDALLTLSGEGISTPAETYADNLRWAAGDLCNAVKDLKRRLTKAEGGREVALARLAEIGEHLMSAEEPTVEEKPLKTIEELSGCIDFGGRVVFDSETDEQYIVPLPAAPEVAQESPLNGKEGK